MTGILSILAFEPGWELHRFVSYGLEALSHRGGSRRLVCWRRSERVLCGDLESADVRGLAESGTAIAAWLDGRRFDGQVIEGENAVTLSDRPSGLLSEIARDVERALSTDRPYAKLEEELRAYEDTSVPSFATLTSGGELVVWRTNSGLTPLSIGGYGFDMAITSSETSAIEMLDADVRRHLMPGEGVYMSRRQVRLFRSGASESGRLCLFELLYTARHDSTVDGISVYEFRRELGRRLGRYLESPVDVVTGVPETALPYAVGLSQAVGVPFELGFVGTARRERSMMKESTRERLIAVHLKLNPIRRVFAGKRVAVVDDSMVTGATLKTVAQLLRYRVGARELHVLLASPKLVSSCPYGVVGLDPDSMISAHLDVSQIEKYLDVDSLAWLREEDVEFAARTFHARFCGACFGIDSLGGDR